MNELFRALPALLREFEDNESVREAVAFAAWRKIAGASLKRHAIPLTLFKGRLIVAVADKTWKSHLEQLSGQMIFRLNSVLGQMVVTFIDFRVDPKSIEKSRLPGGQTGLSDEEFTEAALNEVNPKLRESAELIRDENLRSQFLLAAGSCLARRKRMRKLDK